MGYETIHRQLFRAPRQKALTPQVVAQRVMRLLPRGQYPRGRKMARSIAKIRREVSWSKLDRLSEQIEQESQILHGIGSPAPDVGDLVEALIWRGWPYSDDAQSPSARQLCSYCHRPSVGVTSPPGGLGLKAKVCAHHIARTPGAQRAARLTRWAGGVISLHDKVLNEVVRLRGELSEPATEQATIQKLEAVLAGASIDRVTLAWWKRLPDLELPIRISAHLAVEAEYRRWVTESRIEGGKRGGAKGGRPRMMDDDKVSRAQLMMSSGSSLRQAARGVGMSPSSLSRRLRAAVQ